MSRTSFSRQVVVDWTEEPTTPQLSGVVIEEDWYQEDTRPYVDGFSPMVSLLLHLAEKVDPNLDNPYMPYPCTPLPEAISYLGHHGKLGIHGGYLYYHEEQQSFSVSQIGGCPQAINLAELRALLRANYSNGG